MSFAILICLCWDIIPGHSRQAQAAGEITYKCSRDRKGEGDRLPMFIRRMSAHMREETHQSPGALLTWHLSYLTVCLEKLDWQSKERAAAL